MTAEEKALKERASKLGYKLRRRGKNYHLISDEGSEMISEAAGIDQWLGMIERGETIHYSTACGIPMHSVKLGGEAA